MEENKQNQFDIKVEDPELKEEINNLRRSYIRRNKRIFGVMTGAAAAMIIGSIIGIIFSCLDNDHIGNVVSSALAGSGVVNLFYGIKGLRQTKKLEDFIEK